MSRIRAANPSHAFNLVSWTRLKISHLTELKSCQLPDFAGRQNAYAVVMKILIADPHPEVQSALHLILDRIPEVSRVNEAGSLVQLLAQCAQSCPDLILFDLDLIQPHPRMRARTPSPWPT